MADRVVSVTFQSHYEGDIGRHLREEREEFSKFQKWLTDNPLTLSVTVDMNGVRAQVDQVKSMLQSGLSGVMKGPSILGPDGAPAAATVKELSRAKGLLQEISTVTYGLNDKKELVQTGEFLKQVEQLGNGMERIQRFKKDDAGDWQIMSSAEKDVRNVKQIEDGLKKINREFGPQVANARGRGDKSAELEALKKQKAEVDQIVQDAAKGGFIGSPAYARAEGQQDRLAARIANMYGTGDNAAQKEAEAARKKQIDRAIKGEEARAAAALKANKLEMDQAERLLPDRVKYEAEINRLYQERAAIFQKSKSFFQQMDKDLLAENRPDLANKAFNRGLNAESQVNQSVLDQSRAITDSQRRGQKEWERESAKTFKADVDRQTKESKEREKVQADLLRQEVEFKQKLLKEQAARQRAEMESQFRQELQDIKSQHERRIAEINRLEKQQVAATRDSRAKLAAAEKAHQARQAEYQSAAYNYGALSARMRGAGFLDMGDQARGRAMAVGTAAAKDMVRFEEATRRSGHALDFHSGSLLRNAATFLRWQIPMRAVMAVQQAFTMGVESAIRVDRQFATLQTVFNGTAQDAALLKKETLDLAMAQGRTADEAMDSSIRWSRLGMTRLQVLEATRVSLMAANVAEITAAESAEKLSGIYATFKLDVGDLSGVLNRLNSVSNNYNVTVKDLFEGIARVSGVARQSGLELRDLEGIIGAVTGATGRPGQEIGNALKTIITRLADPKIGGQLKKAFDIDMTGPNGDLKDMSQILRELADVYPTLNKAEQQRFLMLTAGTRQASRMAQVMTEYRQGQILAAQAAMDHGASERENEKILDSLQSRIEKVRASWTDLATALGDAGGFDKAGNFLRMIQAWVNGIGNSVDDAGKKARDFIINDVKQADIVSQLGDGRDWFGLRTKFDRSEVEKALASLKEAQSTFFYDATMGAMVSNKPSKAYVGGPKQPTLTNIGGTRVKGDYVGITDQIKKLEEMLDVGGDNGFTDGLKKSTAEVSNLREEVEGLERARWVFDSLARSVASNSIDTRTLNREFESMVNLLLSLPDGQAQYNTAVKEFNDLASKGNNAGLAAMLDRLSKLFSGEQGPKSDKLRDAMRSTTATLDKQVADLEAKKAKLMEGGASSGSDEIKDLNDKLKDLRSAINQVNAAVDGLDKKQESAFGVEGSRRISNYIDDILSAAKAFGEAFKDFGLDAENDPVSRIMQRHRRALDLGRQALVELKRVTNSVSSKDRENAIDEIARLRASFNPKMGSKASGEMADKIAEQQKIIDKVDEADLTARSRIDTEEERLEQLRRELDYEEAILNLKRRQSDASRQAADSARAWRVGETDSDKDSNQAAAAIQRIRSAMIAARAGLAAGASTPQSRAESLGVVTQDEATARNALQSMQQRNYDIDAARRQIAYDTVKALKDQTQEASKQFQFASRADQIRAASLANSIKRGGAISQDEFMMLSQGTRQALANYLPQEAPGAANEIRVNAERTRAELDAEQERLRANIEYISTSLRGFGDAITQWQTAGGPLDPLKGAIAPKPLQDAPNTRESNPVVNLNIDTIAVQVKLADQLGGLLNTYVDQRISNEVRAMEARLRQQPIPNPQGSVE